MEKFQRKLRRTNKIPTKKIYIGISKLFYYLLLKSPHQFIDEMEFIKKFCYFNIFKNFNCQNLSHGQISVRCLLHFFSHTT